MNAAGYEAVRTIHLNHSIVSRMEAVYVREGCMKLHAQCGHLKKPLDIIRHLEDEIAKAEVKLRNFPELKLTEADKCSLLLQAVSQEARQYVALHGDSKSMAGLTKSLKYFEEQLRMCELPGSSRAVREVLCDYCGKKGHKTEQCWQKKRDEAAKHGQGPPKGKDKGKGKGDTPKGKPKGKGEHAKGDTTPRGSVTA